MNIKKVTLILLSASIVATAFAGCSNNKSEKVDALSTTIAQIVDKDDTDNAVVTEKETSNIVILKDEAENSLSLIPIMDVTNKTMISAYIQSATDKTGKAITDKALVGKVIAITCDISSGSAVNSVTLKDNKKIFLKFLTDKKGNIVAVQNIDGKYYEVTTSIGQNRNVYMHLTADSKGKPIEVEIKKTADGKTKVVEKSTGKTVADDATTNGKVNSGSSSTTTTTKSGSSGNKPNNDSNSNTPQPPNTDAPESADKVVTVTDYSSLADINVLLKKNSKAEAGLAADSPVKVNTDNKVSIKDGVLYLTGNGDYYITQNSDCSTWYGKIVVTLGTKGLARVRMAGVTIVSNESNAIEFIDKDSVINDTEVDSEVLISYNNTSTNKNNPDAILSFVDSTTNNLTAEGNSTKGAGTIYSQCKLSIKGHGTANITSKNKNGIQSARSVGIQNATINIKSIAAKGIRVEGMLDIEENAKITVDSLGDSVRCDNFVMDTDVKTTSGAKDLSTGSTVTLNSTSADASATTGDGIDANDSVIVRAGKLDINVSCVKAKYGVKVRRVDNEEFLKVIKSEKISNIKDFINAEAAKNEADRNPYYNNVVLNEKEYTSLLATKNISSGSADYQGIRTSAGADDTFRITGGTVKAIVKVGRNSTVLTSTNSQGSINAMVTDKVRTIKIDGFYNSGTTKVGALLYSGSDVNTSKSYTVTFGKAPVKELQKTAEFNGKAATVFDK